MITENGLARECKRLHPGYSDERIDEWVRYVKSTHPSFKKSKLTRLIRRVFPLRSSK